MQSRTVKVGEERDTNAVGQSELQHECQEMVWIYAAVLAGIGTRLGGTGLLFIGLLLGGDDDLDRGLRPPLLVDTASSVIPSDTDAPRALDADSESSFWWIGSGRQPLAK